ncbi:MAG: diacylglycerol kinase [Magnetococcales bacterium]|nr:diacylglycerol kinase [Magnetococcales bacterium]
MGKPGNKGIKRIINACGYSVQGIRAAWREEEAFRQETMMLVPVVIGGLWLGETVVQQVLLIGSWIMMMTVELLNSAIEAVVDRIGPEHHPLAGRAKDMGSAAVLLTSLVVLMLWGAVVYDRFLATG